MARARLGRAGAALLLTAAIACASEPSPTVSPTPTPSVAAGLLQPSEPFGLTAITVRDPEGARAGSIEVYDAFEPAARQRGLMGRKRLPDGAGMVFRFPEDHRGGFWMKDTLIPLSIAFFKADGTVVRVLDMPPCRADPCPSYDPKRRYRGALEVNRGFFAQIGLTEGWRLELPSGLPAAS